MNVNGISSVENIYTTYESKKVTEEKKVSTETAAEETGVIYEASEETETTASKSTGKVANPDLVAKLKADLEERTNQLQALVQQLISKQANAYGNATDIWGFLREGNFTVDAETKAQAQEDISENGYWGVNQTSDRIIDFAKALAGDDTDKLNDMLEAFKKGYKQAEETWGGELPELSKNTYDAVIEKFEKLINGQDE